MTLKRISDKEIWVTLGSPDDWKSQTIGFILDGKPLEKPKPIALDGKYGLVAQAQLEADLAVIVQLFEEIEEKAYWEGKICGLDALVIYPSDLQALKQKYLKADTREDGCDKKTGGLG